MPRRIEPTAAALADFDDIFEQLARRRTPAKAAEVLRKLDHAIQYLADQPQLGRPYPQRGRALRVLTHGEYLVFYEDLPGVIVLVRVLNGRRNIPDLLTDLGEGEGSS
jgi:plasmid stabilization system protein ParE